MNTRRLTSLRMIAVVGTTMAALAGCGGGGSGAHPSASASGGNATHQGWIDVAKCMRANGYPNYPDPVENGRGGWEIPISPGDPVQAPAACDAVVRKAKQADTAQNAPSAAEMTQRRLYAKCIREHGVANFPDPDTEGNFDMPPEMRNDPALPQAREACKQYAPPQRPK